MTSKSAPSTTLRVVPLPRFAGEEPPLIFMFLQCSNGA